MADDRKSIVSILVNRYVDSDPTPEHLVSSHWKELGNNFSIQASNEEVTSLYGLGFGYSPKLSIGGKLLSWATIACYLGLLGNRSDLIRLVKKGMALAGRMGIPFTYDCFRQICSYALLNRFLTSFDSKNFLIIGDGFGFLSAFIKEMISNSTICLVDIGKTLIFQAHYCLKAHPSSLHRIPFTPGGDPEAVHPSGADFIYCPAEFLSRIQHRFDIAVNIASMQEMNNETIRMYFGFMRRHLRRKNLFYCCNREKKVMPGGEISCFQEYPWLDQDIHLIDDLCPWHRFFLSPYRTLNGPKCLGVRVPMINHFDGDHLHRLSVIHTADRADGR